jgi:uncharacterized protein (TIGR03437 family)
MRTIILLLFAGLPMLAQFSGLATTTDGSQLYFSSTLRLRGSTESDAPKIFQHGTNFSLFREVLRDNSVPDNLSNYYELIEPQVSGDGAIVAYTSTPECYDLPTVNCQIQYLPNVVGTSPIPTHALPFGHARLSPDGRYLATCCLADQISPQLNIFDFATGQSFALPGQLGGDGLQAFADGGMVMSSDDTDSVSIIRRTASGWDNGTIVTLNQTGLETRLSRDGSTILYVNVGQGLENYTAYPLQLIVHSIASGQETVLETVTVPASVINFGGTDGGCCLSPWISDDGKVALYLAPLESGGPLEVFVQNTDGSGRRSIANLPEGFNATTLSGDGKVAYAATPLGRLLRIDVESGATSQLSGPIPFIGDLQPCAYYVSCSLGTGAVAPGSVVWMDGSAFAGTSGATSVLVNGIKAPVFVSSDSYVRVQIPWEAPVNQRISFVVENGNPQPFESVNTENSEAIVPVMRMVSYEQGTSGYGVVELYHQNFSSLVSESQPAAPNEILHLYMNGLGPVSPAVSTGEKAPSQPLSRIVNPIGCAANIPFTGLSLEVPVEFAGLAPGLTGIYQVDIKAVAGFPKDGSLICTVTDSSGTPHSAQAQLP